MAQAPNGPIGLFGWVRSNNFRSASYFLAFALAAQILAATLLFVPLALLDEAHSPFFGTTGYLARYVPIVFFGSLVLFAAQMMLYTSKVQSSAGFVFVDARDEPRLCAITENLLTVMGLPAPFVAVIESPATNAFACGVSRSKSILVVTRGLLDELNDAELEAVLAHELVHIRNNDVRLMAAANICVANLRWMHKWNPLHFRNAIQGVVCIGFPVFFPLMIVGGLVGQLAIRGAYGSRLIISAAREYVADAEAARLTHNPASLASALFKVKSRYHIAGSREEDEAMMIAGDSMGPTASHPQIEERVEALSATTGSMVFNAPGAHEQSQSRRYLNKAAGAVQKHESSVFRRVGQVTGENIFGLTKMATWTFFAALALSVAWQGASLLSPSSVMAKMDVRHFGDYLGTKSLHCPFAKDAEQCFGETAGDFSRFANHDGTLLGFMVQRAESARQVKREHSAKISKEQDVKLREYTGESGLLEGYQMTQTRDGKYYTDGMYSPGGVPDDALLAEVRQVGCFHEHMSHGEDAVAEFSMTEPESGVDFRDYPKELGHSARMALANGDAELLAYAKTRRDIVRVAFDLFGLEGLGSIQRILQSETHKSVERKLEKRLLDPAFSRGKGAIERAELMAIVEQPDRYVPCLALHYSPRGIAGTETVVIGPYKPAR